MTAKSDLENPNFKYKPSNLPGGIFANDEEFFSSPDQFASDLDLKAQKYLVIEVLVDMNNFIRIYFNKK